uniref:Uncharacterized protein n=2 Tax=Spongospora subterranea TaxID=70186 RepID=A0A0H5R4I6_9EUKA|eukprot:CRZ08796.1 hypothetical protein [Spongospora subterranea]
MKLTTEMENVDLRTVVSIVKEGIVAVKMDTVEKVQNTVMSIRSALHFILFTTPNLMVLIPNIWNTKTTLTSTLADHIATAREPPVRTTDVDPSSNILIAQLVHAVAQKDVAELQKNFVTWIQYVPNLVMSSIALSRRMIASTNPFLKKKRDVKSSKNAAAQLDRSPPRRKFRYVIKGL